MSSASGCLVQIAALGAQNAYLNCDPHMTFFKNVHRRCTNFAIGHTAQQFEGATGLGRWQNAKIDRAGDLLRQVWVHTVIPATQYSAGSGFSAGSNGYYWTNGIGYAMLQTVDVRIGGQVFDTQGHMSLMIDEFLATKHHGLRLYEAIGYADTIADLMNYALQEQHIYAPLRFWFNRWYAQALPIIALQHHEVRIYVQTQAQASLGIYIGPMPVADVTVGVPEDFFLLLEFIYLDVLERRLFAHQAHEYVIEQLQFAGTENHTNTQASQNITVNFNHPSMDLRIVMQQSAVAAANETFNWSGPPDANGFLTDPFLTLELLINSHVRFYQHPAQFYRYVVTREYYNNIMTNVPSSTGLPQNGGRFIYCVPFAINEHDLQYSGSLNFSRIDNTQLRFTFNSANNWTGLIWIFCRNWNVIKIVSGMAGLRFAS